MVHAVLFRDPGARSAHQSPSREPGGVLSQAGGVEEEEILHTHPFSVRLSHNPDVNVFEQHDELPGELELYL